MDPESAADRAEIKVGAAPDYGYAQATSSAGAGGSAYSDGAALLKRMEAPSAPAPRLAATYSREDEEGMIPIMLEQYLEKAGMMPTVRKYLNVSGQIRNEFVRALVAEFWGTLLFQVFGGAAPPTGTAAAPANGFALVAVVYAFANISGAHLNPAVTFALMLTGHMRWWRGLLYMIAQILGSIFGSLIYAGLIPGLQVAHDSFGGVAAPGCFGPGPNVTKSEIFGWEVMMTFLLVLTVYASAVVKPGHGNTAPLAIGLALYASALTGGPYTGASLNPARTIGPACVFMCNIGLSFLYIFAEFFGGACAAGLSIFLYGRKTFDREVAEAEEAAAAGKEL